jgi:DNA-binding transcriptional regulator LsrR (DeoR family)
LIDAFPIEALLSIFSLHNHSMPQPSYTDDQLILAARLYFIDGLPQAQIGKLVNVSQSKVSRMLAMARERGLVRVTVPEYEPRNTTLERSLKSELGVDAVVIRSTTGSRIQDLRQALGYFAAPVVSTWIRSGQVVAIAGGRTMRALVDHMRPTEPTEGVTVVQAMGSIDSAAGAYDAMELGRRLASTWSGSFLTLNTPAILPDAEMCRQLQRLDQIRVVFNRLAKADLALVGIGSLDNSVFLERKVIAPREIAALRDAGAVGEILGRFYDCDGRECDTKFRDRVFSLSLDKLRRVPQVAAVVSGSDRSAAVVAAIRGGLIKTLIIDQGGAAAILSHQQV